MQRVTQIKPRRGFINDRGASATDCLSRMPETMLMQSLQGHEEITRPNLTAVELQPSHPHLRYRPRSGIASQQVAQGHTRTPVRIHGGGPLQTGLSWRDAMIGVAGSSGAMLSIRSASCITLENTGAATTPP